MKKRIIALAAVMTVILMTGCSRKDQSSGTSPGARNTSGEVDYGKVKVGVLINITTTDGGWSQSHGVSFEKVKADLGLADEQMIVLENVLDAGPEASAAIENLISEGCNMIFGTSSGFTDPISAAAARYPDIKFHQFEGRTGANVSAYSVRDIESIFMCGYVAGKMSKSDALGFMAAQPQASVVRAVNSFAAGARYARPDATVQVIWANSWYDPAVEKEGASGMLQSGINALGYHGSTTAVMQAAEAAGGYATGFHIDMHDYAPRAVLTSFMWNWAPIYEEYITSFAKGTWTNDTLFLGMDRGCASTAPFNADIIPAGIIADCEAVKAKLIAGEIEVFPAPVKDNLGKTVLAQGEFSDTELINMMFLLDNVIGKLP
ncbi:MAG: BMP family ABC transporter substrate-binding protein [Spirochaetaceae bacterium]|nr:BMP family ABC transporter substrate-binding protein [Spirochaetaceae bacterium]